VIGVTTAINLVDSGQGHVNELRSVGYQSVLDHSPIRLDNTDVIDWVASIVITLHDTGFGGSWKWLSGAMFPIEFAARSGCRKAGKTARSTHLATLVTHGPACRWSTRMARPTLLWKMQRCGFFKTAQDTSTYSLTCDEFDQAAPCSSVAPPPLTFDECHGQGYLR
jgi:hypothetical protein